MKGTIFSLAIVTCFFANAQKPLPLQYSGNADTAKPLIVYLSGDGGMNGFSNALIKSFNAKGYAVLTLNSKDYFWKKKDAQQFAADMSQAITSFLKEKKRSSFFVLGYSFGADVTPFLATRMPAPLAAKCRHVVLLSPSPGTGFEIKIADMFGFATSKGKNVINELNKMKLPLAMFFGKDEAGFPLKEVTIKKQVVIMEGGHHYDNNVAELTGRIITYAK